MPDHQINLEAQLVLNLDQKLFASPRRMALLAAIADTGSLSQGAKQVGMSYKAAWDAINDMNQRAAAPLLLLAAGGKGGGGAVLTPMGERFLKLYDVLETIQQRAVLALQDTRVPLESLLGAISQFSLQSSARNQYLCRVLSVQDVAGMAEVAVQLSSGLPMVASITAASVERLALQPGGEVMVLIKAPAVVTTPLAQAHESDTVVNRYSVTVAALSGPDMTLQLPGGDLLYARVAGILPTPGETITVTIDPDQVMLATLTP